MPKQTICLSMIVKDEAPVIARCLASVLPIIDTWIICDTGSTDGTQDIISDFFQKHGKPGELHQRSWQDFAHNRTEALALARPRGDYTLIIDADDLLVLPPRYKRPFLTADSYTLDIVHLELRHARTQLVRSALPWRYEGVLHEFLSYPGRDGARIFPETKSQRSLAGVEIHVGEEGARRRSDAAARFARDAHTVSNALLTETDPFLISRYTFYLARSQADAGDKASALETYLKRATLGFWQQEVFISLYEAARIKVGLEHEENDVIAAFTRAAEADRSRAEALYSGARYCRERGQYQQGYEFAKRGINLRPPPGALFVQPWIYEYGLLDEFAVNAYWTGDYNACIQACRRLLKLGGRLPADYRTRVEANARFARDKLREPQVKEPLATTEPDSASPEAPVDPAPEPPAAVQEQPTNTSEPQPTGEQPTPAEHAAPTTPITGSGQTLHVLGVAHTIPHEDYLVCAFTGKVLAFPDLVQPHGWHVVEYSNEGSSSNARDHIVILTRQRLQELSKRRSRDEPMDADVTNEPLQEEFQRILLEKIKARAQPGEIVCHVFGPNMQVVDALPKCHHVESSVGYTASPGLHFRIYESSAWMHWHLGKASREDGSNYNWVIPSSFDVDQWPYCGSPKDYAVYLGRVTPRKGMATLVEIARRMPDLPIHVYGPGDPTEWAKDGPPNLLFKGLLFGAERAEAIRQARCMLMPTVYVEPFGFSGIEAQLCGVPLIGTSFGAFQETIIDGVTGYRCHTLADWLAAIRLSATLERKQISDLARRRYSREAIGQQYNWAFQQLADLSGPGWYGEVSRKFADFSPDPKPHVKTINPPSRSPSLTAIVHTPTDNLSSMQFSGTGSVKIPKTVVQTFRNAPEPHVRSQFSRFLDGTWDYRHFTDEQVLSYFADNLHPEFPDVASKFASMPTGAHKADLFRYYYLFINGGVFIDSDAILKGNIDGVCRDYDFFAVRSGWVAGTIFQGFIGTTAGNNIIHEALQDAYDRTPDELGRDYNTLCRALDRIVRDNEQSLRVKLFDETLFDNGTAEVFDESGTMVLLHFWGQNAIPKITGTSSEPWNR